MRNQRPNHRVKAPGTSTFHWHAPYLNHPRSAIVLAVAIVVLLLADLALIYKRNLYSREHAELPATITRAQTLHAEALAKTEQNLEARRILLARREALLVKETHLTLDSSKGIMYLQRDRAILREMPVRLGPALTRKPSAPLRESRRVLQVVDDNYRYQVPEAAFLHRGEPVPAEKAIAGALGPLAVLLEGGAVIYSRPKQGQLGDETYLLPRGILVARTDLEGIKETLHPGMRVYLY